MSNLDGCVRTQWGLLGEWWCAPDSMEARAIAATVHTEVLIPGAGVDLIADRLYGGFRCANDQARHHVYFASGQYTYLGQNHKLEPEERVGQWFELMKANPEGWTRRGPFTADAPTFPVEMEPAR